MDTHHVEKDEHVNRKAVGNSRNVLEKPTFPSAILLVHVLSNKTGVVNV